MGEPVDGLDDPVGPGSTIGTAAVANAIKVSVAEKLAAMGKPRSMVAPITTAELQPPRPAKRPANSVLENSVLRSAGIPLAADFREPLQRLVARLRP